MAEHRGGSGNFAEDRGKHPKPGVKADSTAAGTLKMILSVHPKPVRRVVRTVMAAAVNPVTASD